MSDSQTSEENSFESSYSDAPTETPAPATPKIEANQAVATTADPMKELIARMDKFQASHDTLAGHIGGLSRAQQEFRNTLAAAQAATGKVSNAPTQAELNNAIKDPDDWAALKKEYPQWAGATEKIIDAKVKATAVDKAAIDKAVADRVAGETAAVRTEMIDSHLDAIVDGDWKAVVASPAFDAWIDAQKPEIKALAESSKMTDAAKMLRLFESSKNASTAPAAPSKEVSARNKRVQAALNPRGAGGHAEGNTEIDSFEAGYSG